MRDFSEYKASAWALIAANILPLFGVLLWGWDTFAIVGLYWTENVIIGAINVLKLLTCDPDPAEVRKALKDVKQADGKPIDVNEVSRGSKWFLAPFFAFHYGFFCMVHGAFVFAIFDEANFRGSPLQVWQGLLGIFTDRHLGWAAGGLAASHLYSYFRNFLAGGEYRRTTPAILMVEPYARVVVLHIAILFGGWVNMFLGSSMGLLVLLIFGKTALDLKLHLREREKFSADSEPIMPEEILHEVPNK